MISNERHSPYGRSSHVSSWHHHPQQNPNWQPKPPVREDSLKSSSVQIERKTFIFSLKENPRGRLLRITEDIAGRHNSIIIPATGLADFKKVLDEIIKASEEIPPTGMPQA
jgi:hypothetical protein